MKRTRATLLVPLIAIVLGTAAGVSCKNANSPAATTTTTTVQTKAIPEWTVTLTFKTNTGSGGTYQYLAQSRITWSEKGGATGYDVTSFFIRYFDEQGKQFTSQSWTADSIRNAWGGSARIAPGGSKAWDINYPLNMTAPLTRLTAQYESTAVDERGNTTQLTDQKTSTLSTASRR